MERIESKALALYQGYYRLLMAYQKEALNTVCPKCKGKFELGCTYYVRCKKCKKVFALSQILKHK